MDAWHWLQKIAGSDEIYLNILIQRWLTVRSPAALSLSYSRTEAD